MLFQTAANRCPLSRSTHSAPQAARSSACPAWVPSSRAIRQPSRRSQARRKTATQPTPRRLSLRHYLGWEPDRAAIRKPTSRLVVPFSSQVAEGHLCRNSPGNPPCHECPRKHQDIVRATPDGKIPGALGSQEPFHAGKYRPQPANHGDPDRRQIQRRSQPLTELFHCELRKASASDKRSRRRRNSRYRSVMLTAVGFLKAFLGFFDFGRTSTVVRLRAFMGTPCSCLKNSSKRCAS
jgi:hypothetical protein